MAPTLLTIDEHELGLTWVIDEPMRRASHALVDDGRVWFVDPVDVPEAVDQALELGEPAGVIQLLDRHPRDNEALAERFGVPHLRLPDAVPDSPFEVVDRHRPARLAREGAVVARARTRSSSPRSSAAGRCSASRPASTSWSASSRPASCATTTPPTCSSATAAASTARRPSRRSSTAYRRSRKDLPARLVKLPFSYR